MVTILTLDVYIELSRQDLKTVQSFFPSFVKPEEKGWTHAHFHDISQPYLVELLDPGVNELFMNTNQVYGYEIQLPNSLDIVSPPTVNVLRLPRLVYLFVCQ